MGFFGNLSMASGFALVLGCLIALTFVAGFIKVCYNKRRLTKHEKLDELKLKGKGPKGADQEMLNKRETDEGDLFGVRALEAGYFGGVAQSRPGSPASSRVNSYVLAPQAGGHSASSSNSDLPLTPGVQMPKAAKPKPSPLRLQPTDPDFRPPSSSSAAGAKGSSYMPITGLTKSPDSLTHSGAPTKDWVSPLDAQFNKTTSPPGSPESATRPTSYLPRLNFPENSKAALVVPTPAGSMKGPRSEVASIVGSEASENNTRSRIIETRSPTTRGPGSPNSTYQQYIPSRGGREPTRSIFPAESQRDRSSSRTRGQKSPTSGTNPASQSSPLAMESDNLPENNREWDNEQAVIRDPIVNKKGVSVTQRSQSNQDGGKLHAHKGSGASSIYSNTNAAPSDWNAREQGAKVKEDFRSRSNSNSTSHSRSSSSNSLARARNSIRQSSHQRNASSKSNHRNSRDRDQIHYDPSSQRRDRSGSVQGRAVDFDQPRESPFLQGAAAPPSHTASSSVSSFGAANSKRMPSPARGQGLLAAGYPAQEKDRLSVMSKGRGRSESDSSQASMGDFYDAYYRQSIVSQRVSAYQTQSASAPSRRDSATTDMGDSTINPGFNFNVNGTRKAPPPLLGMKALDVDETIIEMPSPNPTIQSTTDRFPSRV